MRVEGWLKSAAVKLEKAEIGTARLDCLVLLADELNRDKAWVLAHADQQLNTGQIKRLAGKLSRRASHEPLSYIRGHTEFYGRQLLINKQVLEPRPESEAMIELLKEIGQNHGPALTIVDVGTGSGALAVIAKLELPGSRVLAVDIDRGCLPIARQNAQKYSVNIEFFSGDLLQPLPSSPYSRLIILANLPYVPDNWQINPAAGQEPRLAIFGGPDGLNVYRQLFNQLQTKPAQFVLTESLPPQHSGLAAIANQAGYRLQETDGFVQLFALASPSVID